MKIALLVFLLGFISSTAQAKDLSYKGSLGVTSNYVLFGETLSDNKQSLQSNIELQKNGFYSSLFVNSIKVKHENEIQTWTKLGYQYDYNKGNIRADYIIDYGISNKYKTSSYIEVFVEDKHLEIITLNSYFAHCLDTGDWTVISLTGTHNVTKNNKISLTAGKVNGSRNYYEALYNYKINHLFNTDFKYVYTNYYNGTSKDNFIFGLNLSF